MRRAVLIIAAWAAAAHCAIGQDAAYFRGMSAFLSSRYADAIENMGHAAARNEPELRADIFYIKAISYYFTGNSQEALKGLDSAAYYAGYGNAKNDFYSIEAALKYKAMAYRQLGMSDEEHNILEQMAENFGSDWAKTRLSRLGQ
jgi:tetratricopeptide (TPR) repeat protein